MNSFLWVDHQTKNMISVNKGAEDIVLNIISTTDRYGIEKTILENNATVLDFTNANFDGSLQLARICMGGLCEISQAPAKANMKTATGFVELEMLEVKTSEPIIACMGAQYAGWQVKVKKINDEGKKKTHFKCMSSGPARALAVKEKELYEEIDYKDSYNRAFLVLETNKKPDELVAEYVAKKCKVTPDNVFLLYAPTACLAGSVQIAARIVETSIHKFLELGMEPAWIKKGSGICPVAPVADDDFKAMGWTNDCIICTGNVTLEVEVPSGEESKLVKLVKQCPSSSSSSYGKPFAEVFKEAGGDFYKIDPGMFAPARITVVNRETSNIFTEGDIDPSILDFS